MGRQLCFVPFVYVLIITLACSSSSVIHAKVVEHTFHVGNMATSQMCQERTIIAVNGSVPGPTIRANEGDTLIVHVFNKSPYDVSIHWHGVFQLFSAWADGPAYATQCPIKPGNKYTYKFKVTKQEGTLWWHAHASYMRATVYGALIIRPRQGRKYPFPKPYKEVPIMLGEWWNANVMDVEQIGMTTGGVPNISDAYSINGRLGDFYACSKKHTYKLNVTQGKTYLLRIVNAALNAQLFFKIAKHKFIVVAVDASYTEPYHTDVFVIAPGQTVDVLMETNQPVGDYYMAARPYNSAPVVGAFNDDTTTTGILHYTGGAAAKNSPAIMPILPALNDTATAHKFYTSLTGLTTGPFSVPVARNPDEKMFITFGLGISLCRTPNGCVNSPFGPTISFSASMNNHSFLLPARTSLLEAFSRGVKGVYTEDFPDQPPLKFDYTKANLSSSLWMSDKSTRVKRLKYNSVVEIVFQNTALLSPENHPLHLHGFNFHILAQGFGNYDSKRDRKRFNFVNPQERNTVAVPVGGWAVVRFRANNPGVWMLHCHLDVHVSLGLATAFVVENGPTPETTLPPPPADYPHC